MIYLIGAAAAVFLLVIFVKVRARVSVKWRDGWVCAELTIFFWHYAVEVSFDKLSVLTVTPRKTERYPLGVAVGTLIATMKKRKEEKKKKTFPEYIISKFKIELREASFRIGTGDAASTANVCGALYALFGALAVMRPWLNAECVCITPDFRDTHFYMDIRCILSVPLRNIITGQLKNKRDRRRKNARD